LCDAQKENAMNTKIPTMESNSASTTVLERPRKVSDVTRAILAGEAVQMPVDRPHIVARRTARWARRNAHS
jgi:hypothetical protein